MTDTIQPRFYCRPPHWREIYFNLLDNSGDSTRSQYRASLRQSRQPVMSSVLFSHLDVETLQASHQPEVLHGSITYHVNYLGNDFEIKIKPGVRTFQSPGGDSTVVVRTGEVRVGGRERPGLHLPLSPSLRGRELSGNSPILHWSSPVHHLHLVELYLLCEAFFSTR